MLETTDKPADIQGIVRSGVRLGFAMVIAGLFAMASYSNPVAAAPPAPIESGQQR